MPVPGPRTQQRPVEGYRNPDGELPLRFRLLAPRHLFWPGRSPGTMDWANLHGRILAAGQIRTLWRQALQYVGGGQSYSWTANAEDPGHGPSFGITRALRYMARSLYHPGGTDNTRLSELHTTVTPSVRSRYVTVAGGSVRSRPTVRNRLTSFGARVPTINRPVQATEEE